LEKKKSQLRNVVDQVEQTPIEQRQAAVGLLTTEHRDTWGPVSNLECILF
jgi:carnitine O-acetyltransferase